MTPPTLPKSQIQLTLHMQHQRCYNRIYSVPSVIEDGLKTQLFALLCTVDGMKNCSSIHYWDEDDTKQKESILYLQEDDTNPL